MKVSEPAHRRRMRKVLSQGMAAEQNQNMLAKIPRNFIRTKLVLFPKSRWSADINKYN
jgi:hypothetical protein